VSARLKCQYLVSLLLVDEIEQLFTVKIAFQVLDEQPGCVDNLVFDGTSNVGAKDYVGNLPEPAVNG